MQSITYCRFQLTANSISQIICSRHCQNELLQNDKTRTTYELNRVRLPPPPVAFSADIRVSACFFFTPSPHQNLLVQESSEKERGVHLTNFYMKYRFSRRGGGDWRTREKSSSSKAQNQQTQPTFGFEPRPHQCKGSCLITGPTLLLKSVYGSIIFLR